MNKDIKFVARNVGISALIVGVIMIAAGIAGSCATEGCTVKVDVPQPVVEVQCLELIVGHSHAEVCATDAGEYSDGG